MISIVDFGPPLRTHYVYSSLPSKRSIRLVQILQATSDGMPQCILTTTNLDEAESFSALSYTWGNPLAREKEEVGIADRRCTIICNEHFLEVTHNLFDFLKQAKSGAQESALGPDDKIWIDAICINQSNLQERNEQVGLMAEIYQSAEMVIIWLGERERKQTRNAIQLLDRISASSTEDLESLKRLSIDNSRMVEVLGDYGASTKHWYSLKQLLCRAWFSRIWVIQEAVSAQSVKVLCGGQSLAWEDCVKASAFLEYSVVKDFQTPSQARYTGSNAMMMSSLQESGSLDLVVVLYMTRAFGASDPRDKIFAILGLATLGKDKLPAADIIRADYTRPTEEVFIHTVWAMIKHSENLQVLDQVNDWKYRTGLDLPTWVPDFASTSWSEIYKQSMEYKAAGELKMSLTDLSNPRLLATEGYCLGNVVSLELVDKYKSFVENFRVLLKLLLELPPTYVTGEDRLEVLWRTMIQNGMDWVSPAPTNLSQDFREWIITNLAENSIADVSQQSMDEVLVQLEAYSAADPTRLMPTRDDIDNAMKEIKHSDRPVPPVRLVSKLEHEISYYQHMPLFRTDTGLFGLGQPSLESGNSLWIIPGLSVPIVLKATAEGDNHFHVVGPAYVHGIMSGEATSWDWIERRSIILE